MSVVRPPQSETADPFGDAGAFAPPQAEDRIATPTDSHEPLPYTVPESAQGGLGAVAGSVVGFGVARLIAVGIIFAISTFGWRVWGGVGHDGPPNVPLNVTQACETAFATAGGPSASAGKPVSYDQQGSRSILSFESAGGTNWTCTYDPYTGVATVG